MTHYETEVVRYAAEKSCDENCGFDPSLKNKGSKEDFWMHTFSNHIPCCVCNKCGTILDSFSKEFHEKNKCDDTKGGLEYKMFYRP